MVDAAMWKERKLKARFVRGICRLDVFDDHRVQTGTYGCRRGGVPVYNILLSKRYKFKLNKPLYR